MERKEKRKSIEKFIIKIPKRNYEHFEIQKNTKRKIHKNKKKYNRTKKYKKEWNKD